MNTPETAQPCTCGHRADQHHMSRGWCLASITSNRSKSCACDVYEPARKAAETAQVEQRVQSLLGNYATRAEYAPEPRAAWADIVRDLQWALGHERTYTTPEDRPIPPGQVT